MFKDSTLLFLIFVLLITLFSNQQIRAQNLFDTTHTREYAYHLYTIGDYENAIVEFTVLLQTDKDNNQTRNMLIKSYCATHQYSKALTCIQESTIDSLNDTLRIKKYLLLLENNRFKTFDSFLAIDKHLAINTVIHFKLYSALLQNKKREAIKFITYCEKNTIPFQPFVSSVSKVRAWKYILASAVIPGLGKILYGRTRDGLFTAVTTGVLSTLSVHA